MMSRFERVKADNKFRYLFFGGSSFAMEWLIFVMLNTTGAHIYVANSLSFIAGLVISFLLHRHLSFKGPQQMSQKYQAASYLTLALVNMVLTNIVIGVLALAMPGWLAKALTMVAMVSWNYLILKRIIFR